MEQQFEVAQDLAQEENMELSPALVETEINTEEESIKEDDESNIPKENLSSSNQPVVPEPLQENPKTPELLIPKNTEMNENVDSKFQWKYLLYVLLTIFLMGVSYYAGYYRLLCPCQISQPNVVMEETEVYTNEDPLPQDTTAQEAAKEERFICRHFSKTAIPGYGIRQSNNLIVQSNASHKIRIIYHNILH